MRDPGGPRAGWVLAFDSTRNYTDTTPNDTDTAPLPPTPAKWKYRTIYRVGDLQVGVWGHTVEIMVGDGSAAAQPQARINVAADVEN